MAMRKITFNSFAGVKIMLSNYESITLRKGNTWLLDKDFAKLENNEVFKDLVAKGVITYDNQTTKNETNSQENEAKKTRGRPAKTEASAEAKA